MALNNQTKARMFKAFGDENRLTILELLRGGERCACHLQQELSISQPTLSHHMRILLDAGVISARKEGKWIYYTIREDGAQEMVKLLADILNVE